MVPLRDAKRSVVTAAKLLRVYVRSFYFMQLVEVGKGELTTTNCFDATWKPDLKCVWKHAIFRQLMNDVLHYFDYKKERIAKHFDADRGETSTLTSSSVVLSQAQTVQQQIPAATNEQMN